MGIRNFAFLSLSTSALPSLLSSPLRGLSYFARAILMGNVAFTSYREPAGSGNRDGRGRSTTVEETR